MSRFDSPSGSGLPRSEPSAQELWRPSPDRISASHLNLLMNQLHREGVWTGPALSGDAHANRTVVDSFHRWTIDQPGLFWRNLWKYARLIGDLGTRDHNASEHLWERRFFPDGELNFAENLLRPYDSDPLALAVFAQDENGKCLHLSRQQLTEQVYQIARSMRTLGIAPGDRVAGVLPNSVEAIVCFLAASAIGAVWTCCSPEFGDDAIVDRFAQTTPSLLIFGTSSKYNAKGFDQRNRIQEIENRLPSLKAAMIVENAPCDGNIPPPSRDWRGNRSSDLWFSDILASESKAAIEWKRFPFNHPLYILYSSGTTGAPKCIVHGAGGALIQHVKEHQLHSDIHPQDRLFYFTTTGWMMWNWLISALASRATIYIYDGSPVYPDPGVLWRMAHEHRITHFGASARYYAALEKHPYAPCEHVNTKSIRLLLSTGSPLLAEQYDWIYRSVHPDVHLASISGGTDIVSCFVLGNPAIPVLKGEIQSKGLGMDVQVVDEQGEPLKECAGELVCANAVPSMPLGFWNDPQNTRYQNTYWNRYSEKWWHGDWAQQTQAGGMIIYGRSDSTLNPGGVRIGTAEIYRQLEAFPDIIESIATAKKEDGDEKIALFVKMRPNTELTSETIASIKKRLRDHCSPRHVPSWIVVSPDLPKTMNGKLSEIAVRNAICGLEIGNTGALANPDCLTFFKTWKP